MIEILYAILGIIMAIILPVVIIVIIVVVSNSGSGISYNEYEQRKFGKYGEKKASLIIQKVLRDGDFLFSGVEISIGGRRTELDNVIVNKYGVFIIEVKNYVGHIVGNEDDYEWKKTKVTDAGYIYEKTVKNPIKQVKRQIYLLSEYLDFYGEKVWVRGYAILLHGNSPVRSEFILNCTEDIDRVIHSRDRTLLSSNSVESIKNLLTEK